MKHYLVTGGAGFIGSNLVRELLASGEAAKVTCIDNFDPFYALHLKLQNIRSFEDDPRFTLLGLDLALSSAEVLLSKIPGDVDCIIHLAAKAGVRPSIMDPEGYQRANILGLQHLLDYACAARISQFVFASTSSVYGINKKMPWNEDENLLPISPYAMTKLSGEMLGHVYKQLYGIRFIALRFFTVYGPGQRPDLAIHKFTRALLRGETIPMYGDGSTSRDYTYVDDTIKGILAAARYDGSMYEVINIGNNYTVTLSALIAALEEVTGISAKIEQLGEQPGDVPRTYADITKAKLLLGYEPQTSLETGLRKFYAWFVQNKEILIAG